MNAPQTDTVPTAPRSSRGSRLRPRRLWLIVLSILGGSALAVAAGLGLARVRWSPPSPELVEQLLARKRYGEAAREAEACLARKPHDPKLIFSLARARAGS